MLLTVLPLKQNTPVLKILQSYSSLPLAVERVVQFFYPDYVTLVLLCGPSQLFECCSGSCGLKYP